MGGRVPGQGESVCYLWEDMCCVHVASRTSYDNQKSSPFAVYVHLSGGSREGGGSGLLFLLSTTGEQAMTPCLSTSSTASSW